MSVSPSKQFFRPQSITSRYTLPTLASCIAIGASVVYYFHANHRSHLRTIGAQLRSARATVHFSHDSARSDTSSVSCRGPRYYASLLTNWPEPQVWLGIPADQRLASTFVPPHRADPRANSIARQLKSSWNSSLKSLFSCLFVSKS
ncbi:hypothetical protein BB561_000963 [Smittium simulii]|uniref:Uncharacterized protein n=1 Tax=Smittium simulii TaxID=133385 RepID=A0A2T9YWS6_9FUNG|nr:hypothetical protein BB561_000963 [Smittium simulii]